MLTSEGADDAEIIVRPCRDGSWQVEMPGAFGAPALHALSEREAVLLAQRLCPDAQIRLLPASESGSNLPSDIAPDQLSAR